MRFLNEIDPCLASSSSVNKRAKPSSRVAIWPMKDTSLEFVITPHMELLIANQSRKRKKQPTPLPPLTLLTRKWKRSGHFIVSLNLFAAATFPISMQEGVNIDMSISFGLEQRALCSVNCPLNN